MLGFARQGRRLRFFLMVHRCIWLLDLLLSFLLFYLVHCLAAWLLLLSLLLCLQKLQFW